MSRRKRAVFAVLLVGAAAALVVPTVVFAGPDGTASVRYGNPNAGTQTAFPPPTDHDASFRAYDKINPHDVVISAGGSVDFSIAGFHQVAVYNLGVGPDDIAVPPFPPNLFIDVGTNRKFLGASPLGPQPPESVTFAEPGKYLMICNVTPHFVFAKMYGWITVK